MTKAPYSFFVKKLAVIFAAGALSAPAVADDIVVRAEPLHRTANLTYKVAGKRYYPKKQIERFSQTGKASWYGNKFHGRKTSSGERYNMHKLTAAHPTLPIPSYARVTNMANGKSVIVRINDRGPFHSNRIMDLSRAAAKELGFLNRGTANVRVEQIVPGMENRKGSRFYVSLKSFNSQKDAQAYLKHASRQLKSSGSEKQAIIVKERNYYQVKVGPFIKQENADRMKQMILTSA